jgi:hypothetical protein
MAIHHHLAPARRTPSRIRWPLEWSD